MNIRGACFQSLFSVALIAACSSNTKPGATVTGVTAGSTSAGGTTSAPSGGGSAGLATAGIPGSGGIILSVGGLPDGGGTDAGGTAGAGSKVKIIDTLPAGYTATDVGGYQRGAPLDQGSGGEGGDASDPSDNGNCGNILLGVVRDFKGANEGGHPDFEANIAGANVTPGLVASTLSPDGKPVYASQCEIGSAMLDPVRCPYGAQTTSAANFDQWYRNVQGVNAPYLISFFLQPEADGLFSFESLHYFPLDGAGFMGMGKEYTGELHNFGFTTELHTNFRYRGGEKFTFQGDDDVWVFINDKLAVDLGGLHAIEHGTVVLDDAATMLGITVGNVYTLDLFHAERHTDASTFRIDTNLSFVNCGTVVRKPPQ
jgi:fibro-slime domain-containing protein